MNQKKFIPRSHEQLFCGDGPASLKMREDNLAQCRRIADENGLRQLRATIDWAEKTAREVGDLAILWELVAVILGLDEHLGSAATGDLQKEAAKMVLKVVATVYTDAGGQEAVMEIVEIYLAGEKDPSNYLRALLWSCLRNAGGTLIGSEEVVEALSRLLAVW